MHANLWQTDPDGSLFLYDADGHPDAVIFAADGMWFWSAWCGEGFEFGSSPTLSGALEAASDVLGDSQTEGRGAFGWLAACFVVAVACIAYAAWFLVA